MLDQITSGSMMVDPCRLVTPRRYDLAIKFRLFRHFLDGGDPDAEMVYRWHIQARSGARMAAGLPTDAWKRTLDDYVASAANLVASMAHNGFLPHGAVPVDPNGELLGGAHRVACAIACGIISIPIGRLNTNVWAPSWGKEWFVEHGMSNADLCRLERDWQLMRVEC